jgi:putative inorganic carbon (hco3(-)) transporter
VLEKTKSTWLFLICASFIALNSYFMVRDIYWAMVIPVVIIFLYFYLYKLNVILLFITLATPFAVNLTDSEFGVGISMPTEPLMLGVLIVFVIKLLFENNYDKNILRHPLTIMIIISLVWMFITSLTSQIPLVSFKYLAARIWFVIPFYFMGILLFKNPKNITLFIWFYVVPLLGVIAYTTYNHALWGFNEQAGHWVMEPFYNDHTAYGAVLTMFIPAFAGFTFSGVYSKTVRLFSFIVLAILLMALVLSFSRAAWISLAFSLIIYLIILFRIKMKWIVLALGLFFGIFFLFQNEIWDRLEKNKQGSSANFVEHMQSISNISTDDSNLERINRWQSAFRMFAERPVFGFGPGTYQFEYAPFQHSNEKTQISTNFGDKGNAHSEYIGPLAESGIPGTLFMLGILILTIITGLRVYKKAKEKEVKMISLAILLGLITYFFHGTMNNFLDTDKASVPFWGFIAIIVALDIYYLKKDNSGREKVME